MADSRLINIGYGNLVMASRVIAIVSPQSAPMRRLREEAHEPKWDPAETTGLFIHNGLATIDALLGSLPPAGSKLPQHDFVGVRLVEAIDVTPSDRFVLAPAETVDGRAGATSSRRSWHSDGRFEAISVTSEIATRSTASSKQPKQTVRQSTSW